MTIVTESLPVRDQHARYYWSVLVDRLAYACLILLALTFPFEVPLAGVQVAAAALSDSLTTVKILEAAVIGLWLLLRAVARERPKFPISLLIPVCLWLVALVASTVLAPSYLPHTIRFMSRLLQGLLLAWVAYDLVNSPARWRLVAGCLVIAGAAVGLLGLAEAAGVPPVLSFLRIFREVQTHVGDVTRVSASLGYATIAAMVLEMLIPLTGAFLVTARRRSLKAILCGALAIEVVAMILTLTRSALAGLAVALIFIAAMSYLSSHRRNVWVAIGTAGLGILTTGLLLVFNSAVGLRMLSESESGWYQQRFSVASEVAARPDERLDIPLQLTNTGLRSWQAVTAPVFRLGYTLSHPDDKSFVALDGIRTALPANVSPGQTIRIAAPVYAPKVPGTYLIQWDMVEEGVLWFSWRGSPQGITHLVVAGDPVLDTQTPRLSPANHSTASPPVERPTLWGAALRMFGEKPLFGVGPDNFRWLYGPFLNLDQWDTNIHANSIYLEMLADTGLFGLLAFLWLNWRWLRLAWQRLKGQKDSTLWIWQLALIAALIAWFVHGFLDYFYEFAGAYVLFWLIAGLSINPSISEIRQRLQNAVEATG